MPIYKCNICNYTAKTKSNLNKHFKTKNHKLKELKEVLSNSSKNKNSNDSHKTPIGIINKKDINKSIKALTKTRPYSYSQGAVSRDNKVIAIEGEGGTQKMLKNIKNKGNGVLVKFPKKKQDIRVDLPTIGLNTLKQCKKAGLKGIVLKHKKNILLDKKKCIQYANKNKMFILVK